MAVFWVKKVEFTHYKSVWVCTPTAVLINVFYTSANELGFQYTAKQEPDELCGEDMHRYGAFHLS